MTRVALDSTVVYHAAQNRLWRHDYFAVAEVGSFEPNGITAALRAVAAPLAEAAVESKAAAEVLVRARTLLHSAIEDDNAKRARGRTPVGSGIKHDPDVDWMVQFVFGDVPGAGVARRIDSTIGRLPGLDWFNLLTEARAGR